MFTALNSIDEVKEKVTEKELTFLYITQPNCSVCHGLLPQIEQIMALFPKVHCYTVDASQVPLITSAFHVFGAPTLLMFVEGKEYIREARFVQTTKFEADVARLYRNVTG